MSVHFTPDAWAAEPGDDVVVVDVLRATTTLVHALHHGATRIHPVAEVEEAIALKRRRPHALLAGERGGRKLPNFDLGNSPGEMTAERVAGREIVFTSTNGSHALQATARGDRRWLGAFACASALRERLRTAGSVRIVCAGQNGAFALEDVAFAAWLARALAEDGAHFDHPADRCAARLAPRDANDVRAMLEGSAHGRRLSALGPEFRADVLRCAELDVIDRAYAI